MALNMESVKQQQLNAKLKEKELEAKREKNFSEQLVESLDSPKSVIQTEFISQETTKTEHTKVKEPKKRGRPKTRGDIEYKRTSIEISTKCEKESEKARAIYGGWRAYIEHLIIKDLEENQTFYDKHYELMDKLIK